MLSLEKFTDQDFETLISWIGSPKLLLQWAGPLFKWPLDPMQLNEYIKPTLLNPPKRLIYKAVENFTGKTCGHVELNNINYDNQSATICRVLISEASQNKGYATIMLRKLLQHGFDDLNLRRIELDVFTFNSSAIRCYEKVGFVKEGIKRKHTKYDKNHWDLMGMSMLKEEWDKI